jgi:hypothetical protein
MVILNYGKVLVRLVAKKITFELNDKLDLKFRKRIAEVKGLRRGVIQEAIEEAINLWLHHHEESKRNMFEKEDLRQNELTTTTTIEKKASDNNADSGEKTYSMTYYTDEEFHEMSSKWQ